jgi:hypothetical protein
MPKITPPEQINDCFDLYLKYNGQNFPAIEKEMREKGWTQFSSQRIRKLVKGEYTGWEADFGWKKSLEIKIATQGVTAMTSAESLLFEVETVRKKIFNQLQGDALNRDLVYQHDKYVARTTEILASLDRARDNYANFVFFLTHLLQGATKVSPALAKELCEAEDALLEWAEREFVTDAESNNV